jgi:hypothetical protein
MVGFDVTMLFTGLIDMTLTFPKPKILWSDCCWEDGIRRSRGKKAHH